MALKFETQHDWSNFCSYLLRENRYVLNKKWDNFIEAILFTAEKRREVLAKSMVLFRARQGHYEEEVFKDGVPDIIQGPLRPEEIGAPPSAKAIAGRINPTGISYLYLANDVETAIAEKRPWLEETISVGYFEILEDLKVVDASKDKSTFIFIGEDLSADDKEAAVWSDINRSFSEPVTSNDKENSYIPTQYMSEIFKNSGYDGIIYKSSLTEKGYNIALFNPGMARMQGAQVFKINAIKYGYSEFATPYSVKSK